MERGWELFGHEADVGVRGRGPTPQAAFGEAARALTAVVTDLSRVRESRTVTLACSAPDLELLLYDFLNALVWEMATKGLLFARADVEITGGRLQARAHGEPVDAARHRPAVEVKGATFTQLAVRGQEGGGWVAQCVVDV